MLKTAATGLACRRIRMRKIAYNPRKVARSKLVAAPCLTPVRWLSRRFQSLEARQRGMSQVIALVDADRNILTSVSIALQQEGFVTRVHTDGTTALKATGDNPLDLGVYDIKMPGLGGMD